MSGRKRRRAAMEAAARMAEGAAGEGAVGEGAMGEGAVGAMGEGAAEAAAAEAAAEATAAEATAAEAGAATTTAATRKKKKTLKTAGRKKKKKEALPLVAWEDAITAGRLRRWLEAGGAETAPFRVPMAKKAARGAWAAEYGVEEDEVLDWSGMVQELLCFGLIDSTLTPAATWHSQNIHKRNPASGWSAVNKAHVAALEAAGRMRPAGAAAVAVAKANGAWTLYDAFEAGIVPDDLRAALDANAAAAAAFAAYSKSVVKSGLRKVYLAKRPATRAAWVARIVAAAARGAKTLV